MNTQIIGQLILQFILIGLNAVFACAEIAVLSFNENKLTKLAEDGNKKACRLSKLTQNPAKFLATIQVAITLSGFLGSAFAADNFSEIIVTQLSKLDLGIPVATLDAISVIVITMILSFLTLVFGELVPKRLAMRKTESIALGISGTVSFISKAFAPLVWLLTISTNGILRLMGIDPNADENEVSEEDILMMADAGSEQGIIDEEENILIQNVFEFDDLSVGEIMTHRTEAVMLWNEDTIDEWKKTIYENVHTYYPICEDSADQVIGVLDTRLFFRLPEQTKKIALERAVIKPFFVSTHTKADDLFREMKKTKTHFAIAIDEFGGTDGIITINDLIEQLVGELEETHDDIVALDEFHYDILGDTELTKIERELKTDFESDAATFNGWIIEQMGTIPEKGEEFRYQKFTVKITDSDEKLVLKAKLTIDPPEEVEE
ncbi:MAG: HlyC/CorC family transporter [Clostridia bacterium]|nr:HlyC/CorC family transporter [Clostridia bacterium]